MRIGAHSPRSGCKSLKNSSLAAAGLILLWVFLYSSQLRWCHSMDANQQNYLTDQQQHLKSGHYQLFVKLEPRELLRVAQKKISGSSNAVAASSPKSQPPKQNQFMNAEDGDGSSEVGYEDDKRRVHTGPNPLHN